MAASSPERAASPLVISLFGVLLVAQAAVGSAGSTQASVCPSAANLETMFRFSCMSFRNCSSRDSSRPR